MKYFKNSCKTVSLRAAAVLLIAPTSLSHALPPESAEARDLMAKHIEPYLIESGYCKNRDDCHDKELVFFHDGYKSLQIYVYQSDSKLIAAIAPRIISERARLRKAIAYEIYFYQIAHRDLSPFIFNRPKPICTITFAGEQ